MELYFCKAESRRGPKKTHSTLTSAQTEAKRLAQELREPVYILQAVERIEPEQTRPILRLPRKEPA